MLADALRRLLGRLAGSDAEDAPEILELERRAAIAMTPCTCGHMWHLHEHAHVRTGCDGCGCQRFRPAQPPPPPAAQVPPHAAEALLIRLRVILWTAAWRDRRSTGRR